MMRKFLYLLILIISVSNFEVYGQRVVGDCTITYEVSADATNIDFNVIKNAYKKIYISGAKSFTEVSFNGFEQETIYNESSSNVYILYKMNDEKYMRVLSKEQWMQQYDNYKDAKIALLKETQKLLDYTCNLARITLQDGTQLKVWYTPELKTTISENPYEFKNINGLVLKYEAVVQGKYRIIYTASKIDFSPVPVEKFTIPKSGYRILDNTN